jgi:acetoacetyl-CoA synthetase
MAGVAEGMLSSPSFEAVVAIPRWRDAPLDISSVPRAETLVKFLAAAPSSAPDPPFEHVEFHDPFLVYYSSGTTGVPKAIVHAVGNITLSLVKEGRLHEGTTEKSAGLQV